MKLNTIIVPIIRSDFIEKMLFSLYQHTDKELFNVIVIDQTASDDAQKRCEKYAHLWIRPYRNLGFSKAMNTGIRLADTKYITLANDDIEFMDKRWWQGIIDTFNQDPHIIAVNPMSPKEASWGYGHTAENHETYKPEDSDSFKDHPGEFVCIDNKAGIVPVINGAPFPEGPWTETEYTWLLENHPVWKNGACIDAIAMWCTVFKKTGLEEIGMLEERFYPGGGEDYDMNARAYSCGYPTEREYCDPDFHRRMVASSRSWVWHHWGKSRSQFAADTKAKLFASRSPWNNNDELWGPKFDVWGHYEDEYDGKRKPIIRKKGILIDQL